MRRVAALVAAASLAACLGAPELAIQPVSASPLSNLEPVALRAVGPGADRAAWDMGDGTFLQGALVEHTYQRGGSYLVTLTSGDGSARLKLGVHDIGSVSGTVDPLLAGGRVESHPLVVAPEANYVKLKLDSDPGPATTLTLRLLSAGGEERAFASGDRGPLVAETIGPLPPGTYRMEVSMPRGLQPAAYEIQTDLGYDGEV